MSGSLSRKKHCNHLGLLHIFLGVFSLFVHIPIFKNWISQLEQMIHWSLRPRSCFLNFVPDVWGRLGYEIHSERDLSLRGGGIHLCILSKSFQYFGHLMWRTDSLEKTLMLGNIEGRRRRGWQGMTEDEMVWWHHQLNGLESEEASGAGDGQGSLVCYSPRGHKQLNTTEQLNWAELN